MSILPEADWNRHKETIRQLYCIEQKELQCVREEMKHRYGFNTTYVIISLHRSGI
jgi:hypothetical protein